MATETEAPFTLRSTMEESGGIGSAGERLIAAVRDFYPAELQKAQLLRQNVELSEDLDLGDVSKIASIDVRDAVVRGGERDQGDAWVTYAGYDENGDTVKGAFPFSDVGKSKSSEHVSQVDSLQTGQAADQWRESEAKRAESESAPAEDGAPQVDPFTAIEKMTAKDVVAYMEDNPERADTIKALESAIHGQDARKTVLEWEAPKSEGDGSGDGGGDQGGDGNPADPQGSGEDPPPAS